MEGVAPKLGLGKISKKFPVDGGEENAERHWKQIFRLIGNLMGKTNANISMVPVDGTNEV